MGFRFRKTISLFGFRLNIGKKGVSVSKKIGNSTVTMKQNGDIQGTVNIPKTGVSYTKTLKNSRKKRGE